MREGLDPAWEMSNIEKKEKERKDGIESTDPGTGSGTDASV